MKSTAALLLQGLARNLIAGVRLAAFLRVSRYEFRVSPGDFVLLWLFNLVAWLAGGMLTFSFLVLLALYLLNPAGRRR